MKEGLDRMHTKQYAADRVIARGHEIHDEWVAHRYSSRKIVRYTDRAVAAARAKQTHTSCVQALACLFALDMRIKERYGTLLRCLFSFFSWRRESSALKRLQLSLRIESGADVRNAIEVALWALRERLEGEKADDGDDETHGGKRNGKAEEEAASEEKESEATEETKEAAERTDQEEKEKETEEKEEMPIEEAAQEEAEKERGEKKEVAEPQQEKAEMTAADEKEALAQEKGENLKEENNVSDDESEPSTDKKEEAKVYDDAVDSPPLYEETVRDRSSERTSMIDEMILDNMVKGDKNSMGDQRKDEGEHHKEADISQDTVATQNEKDKSTDKDAFLYEKMVATDHGEAQQPFHAESAKQAETASETKTEQPKETAQNNDRVDAAKQEIKASGEMLSSDDPKVDPDNHVADAINAHMSLESKMALIRMKEEQLREHMHITLEELGMNDVSDVLRVSEPDAISPPRAVQNSK